VLWNIISTVKNIYILEHVGSVPRNWKYGLGYLWLDKHSLLGCVWHNLSRGFSSQMMWETMPQTHSATMKASVTQTSGFHKHVFDKSDWTPRHFQLERSTVLMGAVVSYVCTTEVTHMWTCTNNKRTHTVTHTHTLTEHQRRRRRMHVMFGEEVTSEYAKKTLPQARDF